MPQPAAPANKDEQEGLLKTRYMHVFVGLGVGAAFHPLQYAKVLIQLGHEPLPLERGKGWIFFGRELYYLPNAFKYIRHIKKTDGFFGLYRGLGASICHNLLGLGVAMKTQQYLDEIYPDEVLDEAELNVETEGQCYCRFFKRTLKESICKTAGTIVSRPLQVIMIRRMAQFISGETIYVGILGSFLTIKNDEGTDGLFAGVIPQVVGDLTILWLSKTLLHVVERLWRKYFNEAAGQEEEGAQSGPKAFKQLIQFTIPYVVSSVCYPFSLVSTIMAVNGSPLQVGQSPYTPIFTHWQNCWDYLAAEKQLKRGSKIMFRWYDGPLTYSGGIAYAKTSNAY